MVTEERMRAIEKDFMESTDKYMKELDMFYECVKTDATNHIKIYNLILNIQTIYNEELINFLSFIDCYAELTKQLLKHYDAWYKEIEVANNKAKNDN